MKKHISNMQKALIWVLILVFCASALACTHIQEYIEEEKSGSEQEKSDLDFYSETAITAEEYYSQNGVQINKLEVNDSSVVHTEKETVINLTERGFSQYPITTEVSMNGELIEPLELSTPSSAKRPMYITYYISESGNLWTIMEINGIVYANPAFYNLRTDGPEQVIVSESASLVSYDPISNTFYEAIPDETVLKVIVVNRIDAGTLEKMTAEEIQNHV